MKNGCVSPPRLTQLKKGRKFRCVSPYLFRNRYIAVKTTYAGDVSGNPYGIIGRNCGSHTRGNSHSKICTFARFTPFALMLTLHFRAPYTLRILLTLPTASVCTALYVPIHAPCAIPLHSHTHLHIATHPPLTAQWKYGLKRKTFAAIGSKTSF